LTVLSPAAAWMSFFTLRPSIVHADALRHQKFGIIYLLHHNPLLATTIPTRNKNTIGKANSAHKMGGMNTCRGWSCCFSNSGETNARDASEPSVSKIPTTDAIQRCHIGLTKIDANAKNAKVFAKDKAEQIQGKLAKTIFFRKSISQISQDLITIIRTKV
jgi:hypothetical protein